MAHTKFMLYCIISRKERNQQKILCFSVTRDFIQMINFTEENNQVSNFVLKGIIYWKTQAWTRIFIKTMSMLILTILYIYSTL